MWPAVLWWRSLNFLLRASCVWTLQSKGLRRDRHRRSTPPTDLLRRTERGVFSCHHPSKATAQMLKRQGKRRKWAVNAPSLWYNMLMRYSTGGRGAPQGFHSVLAA